MASYLLIPVVVVVVWLLYKLVALLRADADLTLLSKSLNSSYFQGRVVWVTGASSGIGEELCYQLSRLGAKLILTSEDEVRLKIVRKGLSKPNDAHVLTVDFSDPVATRAATEKALAFFGRIDILFNNAGVCSIVRFSDIQESTHRRLLEINLFAPWIITHDTLPGMCGNGFGHIVNTVSIVGKFAIPRYSSYVTSKFGLLGMMDAIRYEHIDENIHITNVCPGPIRTSVDENSLLGDGSTANKKDPDIEAGLNVQRCCELIIIAVSNQLREVWIGNNDGVISTYIAQYLPSLAKLLLNRYARKKKAEEIKNN